MIVYIEFQKMCDFQIPTTWNDVMMTSSLCFTESVYKTCQRQSTELKLGKLIVHSKFHKIRKFENHVTRNDVIMTSLSKTMKKCGPPRDQINYISFERYWWELSKNVLFIEFEPLCQKLWAFMSNFGIFYNARSPNMAMSRDPRSKFRKKICFPNSALISGTVTKFLVEKLSTSEVISQKTSWGVENTPPPSVLLRLMCNFMHFRWLMFWFNLGVIYSHDCSLRDNSRQSTDHWRVLIIWSSFEVSSDGWWSDHPVPS